MRLFEPRSHLSQNTLFCQVAAEVLDHLSHFGAGSQTGGIQNVIALAAQDLILQKPSNKFTKKEAYQAAGNGCDDPGNEELCRSRKIRRSGTRRRCFLDFALSMPITKKPIRFITTIYRTIIICTICICPPGHFDFIYTSVIKISKKATPCQRGQDVASHF